jgi:hypothetical protein
MSELNVYHHELRPNEYAEFYLKYEADKVIAEKDAEIRRLKNSIAPKQSDKTLQERLNEVCEKHGVSTLQDLDWAFCESEKRHAKDCIEAVSIIRHSKYKRCLAMARWCRESLRLMRTYEVTEDFWNLEPGQDAEYFCKKGDFYSKWRKRWLELAEKFK